MRLPENKIKEAILDTDEHFRWLAVDYFVRGGSTDPTLMPLVIEAVQQYGPEESAQLIDLAQDLSQSEESLTWILQELNDEENEELTDYTYSLSCCIVSSEPALWMPRHAEILEAKYFAKDEFETMLADEVRLTKLDFAACWRELEAFCEKNKRLTEDKVEDLTYPSLLVEALTRLGDACHAKVLEVLSREIATYKNNPMYWLEIFAVRLAGELRLEAATPLLIGKYRESEEFLAEEIRDALMRIGSPGVIEAMEKAYLEAVEEQDDVRFLATDVLAAIHSDQAVATSWKLFEQEQDPNLRMGWVRSLLSQFSREGIDAGRKLAEEEGIEKLGFEFVEDMIQTAEFMGEMFPEYDEWSAMLQTMDAEGTFAFDDEYENDDDEDDDDDDDDQDEEDSDPPGNDWRIVPSSFLDATEEPKLASESATPIRRDPNGKVGRNDKCPCGSGMKFKRCCMPRPTGP